MAVEVNAPTPADAIDQVRATLSESLPQSLPTEPERAVRGRA